MIKYFSIVIIAAAMLSCSDEKESKTPTSSSENITNSVNEEVENEEQDINEFEDIVDPSGVNITIKIEADDQMRFNRSEIKVKSGQQISLILTHTGTSNKESMGHNFVLLQKGTDIAEFASKSSQARDNDYIPEGDDVIISTKLIGGGESDEITFDAPEKGVYDFICSFPGHYALMKGVLIVE